MLFQEVPSMCIRTFTIKLEKWNLLKKSKLLCDSLYLQFALPLSHRTKQTSLLLKQLWYWLTDYCRKLQKIKVRRIFSIFCQNLCYTYCSFFQHKKKFHRDGKRSYLVFNPHHQAKVRRMFLWQASFRQAELNQAYSTPNIYCSVLVVCSEKAWPGKKDFFTLKNAIWKRDA